MSRTHVAGRRPRAWVAAGTALLGAGLLAACGGGGPRPMGGGPEASLPGITDSSVTVGYAVADGGAVAVASERSRADDVDPLVQARVIQAYVDFVNESGGAGGRTVRAEIASYPSVTASPEQALALCSDLTTVREVFAAVLDGHYDDVAPSCYRDAKTLMIDESLVAHDTQEFEENSPYLWSPTHPEYSAFVATQLRTMRAEGWFEGVDGVQVIAADTDVARRTTENVVQPFLGSIGVPLTEVSTVDITSTATLADGTSAALAAGTRGGYERVITIGGGATTSVALADQVADYYLSSWGVATYDAPAALAGNPERIVAGRLDGSRGLGYAPAYDVDGEQGGPFPDPARPAEAVCKGVLDAAGIDLGAGERADYRAAFQYCDATLFLKAALDRVPTGRVVTGAAFAEAAGRIGTGYASSLTVGGGLAQGQYAATIAGRVLVFDASCACFTYKGENVPITAN